jgi:hypothetical protein
VCLRIVIPILTCCQFLESGVLLSLPDKEVSRHTDA